MQTIVQRIRTLFNPGAGGSANDARRRKQLTQQPANSKSQPLRYFKPLTDWNKRKQIDRRQEDNNASHPVWLFDDRYAEDRRSYHKHTIVSFKKARSHAGAHIRRC